MDTQNLHRGFPASLGRAFIFFVQELGEVTVFFLKGLALIFTWPPQVGRTLDQLYFIGAQSIPIVLLTGLATGMVLGLQGYYALAGVGSEGALGSIVALTLIREMGPVLTAIMLTARAGSAMAAEIGVMRISEQIDALQTMQINPLRYLISPRIAAALISFPLLTALFDVIGIIGGFLTGSMLLKMNPYLYFHRVRASVEMEDVTGGFIKAVVFAVIVITICCYQGYTTHRRQGGFGARGVSNSTTRAVVMSCVLILVSDYVITSLLR
jgi:phospholipid/cholesterol/gamma-HCH transport system permease protein